MLSDAVDVLIIGAGPTGAAAARLLTAWGHDVLVIDRPGGDAGRLAESIPPSADKILRTIGALDGVRAAGFLPWRGNTVWWANQPPRIETFPAEAVGYQVVRREFDRVLRTLAASAGTRIEEGRVVDVRLTQTLDASSSITIEHGSGGVRDVHVRIVIDASGRAGAIARHGLRILDATRRTVALAASWQHRDRWAIEDDSHTMVASYPGGWAWSVPIDSVARQFTVMVDPGRSELAKGAPSKDIYLNELAKVAPFVPLLAGAELLDTPWGADASEYTASRYAGPGFLLVGDAGSAINPLSSFGVKKAMASGWLAAIAAHTALTNAAMAERAFAFFDRRERAVAGAAAQQAARFAAEAATETNHPFWLARSARADDSVDELDPDVDALARDPRVLAAFADLKTRTTIRLVAGPTARVEPRSAVRGREIVMDDHLVNESWPDGLRYLRGVDLVAMMTHAPRHREVGPLFEALQSSSPGLELPNFLGALSVLLANGSLRYE